MFADIMITCAPFDFDVLCGESIKIISYVDAQRDEAKWSIRFTDAKDQIFDLPIRMCRTWFVGDPKTLALPDFQKLNETRVLSNISQRLVWMTNKRKYRMIYLVPDPLARSLLSREHSLMRRHGLR